jgi:hypothetical protein
MMKMRDFISLVLGFLLLASCVETHVRKYQNLLEPRVGRAKQNEINALLGNPTYCRAEGKYEKCEYRTAAAQNHPVPDIFRKTEGLGPDLSPYEYFDVLHLYFDTFHVLREWEPVVIAH